MRSRALFGVATFLVAGIARAEDPAATTPAPPSTSSPSAPSPAPATAPSAPAPSGDAAIDTNMITGAEEVEAAPSESKLKMSMPGVGYVGGEIPKGMHLEERRDTSLTWVGLAMFGMAYAPAAGVGAYTLGTRPSDAEFATEGRNERRLKKTLPLMLVPFAGPVIGAGALMDAVIHPPDHAPAVTVIFGTVAAAACMVDMAVQVVGVIVATKGLVSSHSYLVQDAPQGKLTLAPWATPSGGGLGVAGRF